MIDNEQARIAQGPDDPSTTHPNASLTVTVVVEAAMWYPRRVHREA
jgi:hypothetical protein